MKSRFLPAAWAVVILAAASFVAAALGMAARPAPDSAAVESDDGVIEHGNEVLLGAPEDDAPDTGAARIEPTTAAKVEIGLYIMDISHIDFAEGTFAIDAYLWMNWDATKFLPPGVEPAADGSGLPRAPSETLGFVGEYELTVSPVSKAPGYAQFRVLGTLRQEFDLDRFPLDHHLLTIAVEDEERPDAFLQYEPDAVNSGATEFHITGWDYDQPTVGTYTRKYETNFGDRSLKTGHESYFSGIAFKVPIRQVRLAYFVKVTFGLIIATALALMSLLVAHYGVDRLGFPVGALFAVVASQWAVGAALPPRAPPTIADWLHVISFGVILVVTIVNVKSLLVLEAGDPVRSKKIDRTWFWIITPAWVALCVIVCIVA